MGILNTDRRIFFLAVNTGYTKNGIPDNRFLEFYAERSGNGLHCAIVGNVAIPNGHGTNVNTPKIERLTIWKEIAEAISDKGALPGIQLSTTWLGYNGNKGFISKTPEEEISNYKRIASSFEQAHIRAQYRSLEDATKTAIDCGFKHIQLHAAHGYFFNLLLDSRFSKHHQLASELTQHWLGNTIPDGIETSIRISTLTGAHQFDSIESSFIEDLTSIPFDYHDISEGFYNIDKKLIYPSLDEILAARIERTKTIALRNPNNSFIASGKSFALTKIELPKNVHIGTCRDLIANPNFLQDQHNGCKNKMKCHYYSRGKSTITCGRWK